ncbi:hypothetical protein CA267_009425 [Alteromonas pelagimontana]|uniref:Pullulanase n=1 Tax=Alteromonas pelagimontana TaxID=1858656 RepID=A0A6M4MI79_9ALTE|nr:hypothetical protein CA267_009425 [Alteromonas pelagimontana]
MSALVFLSACSSRGTVSIPGITEPPAIQFENLYLRGVFNWWEANDPYKLTRGKGGWFVDVELIADGQPYDFRLSDAYWTPDQTCGAEYKGQMALLATAAYLDCGAESENLQFTPQSTGTYRFAFSPADAGEVRLLVTRLD